MLYNRVKPFGCKLFSLHAVLLVGHFCCACLNVPECTSPPPPGPKASLTGQGFFSFFVLYLWIIPPNILSSDIYHFEWKNIGGYNCPRKLIHFSGDHVPVISDMMMANWSRCKPKLLALIPLCVGILVVAIGCVLAVFLPGEMVALVAGSIFGAFGLLMFLGAGLFIILGVNRREAAGHCSALLPSSAVMSNMTVSRATQTMPAPRPMGPPSYLRQERPSVPTDPPSKIPVVKFTPRAPRRVQQKAARRMTESYYQAVSEEGVIPV